MTRANVDLLATDAFALLLYHLYLGKVDPKSLDPRWNFEPRPIGDQGGTGFVLDALTRIGSVLVQPSVLPPVE